ncbi:DUF397 domain-containing protein [Goodfellowiella coeruleoviolacea]|uniref:DUF397 domain-containing protein n=1 Tax=Goodfellowiella coeruleoviolacea TaxID=334858 RepID=A0AAE3GIA7_9PSEU|nr:DUF397 domain-containing protein [Goodfellowiella coeruleoviolacea]MCP2168153.1 protein of unknown function (DUF397) [Goodfellowiella coeruleoviolacea]
MSEQIVWRRSTYSVPNNDCVELARTAALAAVRDSKNPTGPMLTFGQAELVRFLGAVKAGRLDG